MSIYGGQVLESLASAKLSSAGQVDDDQIGDVLAVVLGVVRDLVDAFG